MKHQSVCCAVLLSLLLISCAASPKYAYQDTVNAAKINSEKIVKTRVSASVEEWRNTGVLVEEGKKYHITAKGQWRSYISCNFTGPDGIGLYKDWCVKSPLFPTIIEGYSHSILIAKIGESESPFVIGAEQEFIAKTTGPLLLRINDTKNSNSDNEGFVDVEIQLKNSHLASTPSFLNAESNSVPGATFSTPKKGIPVDVLSSIVLQRTALIIGNSNYKQSPLKNPVNDAQAMAKTLSNLGFKVMEPLKN